MATRDSTVLQHLQLQTELLTAILRRLRIDSMDELPGEIPHLQRERAALEQVLSLRYEEGRP